MTLTEFENGKLTSHLNNRPKIRGQFLTDQLLNRPISVARLCMYLRRAVALIVLMEDGQEKILPVVVGFLLTVFVCMFRVNICGCLVPDKTVHFQQSAWRICTA